MANPLKNSGDAVLVVYKLFVIFAVESSTASLKISIYWSSPVFM